MSKASAPTCKHCGQPARSDGTDYADVCSRWPMCKDEALEADGYQQWRARHEGDGHLREANADSECAVCHEPIVRVGDTWHHVHGGRECGTGDGSVAYPIDAGSAS